jgi:nucleotide-binding universal stress UspA family protein
VVHAVHLERGELPEAIEAIARRIGCDLIVMGTRGMGAAGNLVLGSVATGVIRCADRPVTLVK